MAKKYATRGKEARVTVSWVVPARLATSIAMIAKMSGRSQSMVATELLDSAMGTVQPSQKAS